MLCIVWFPSLIVTLSLSKGGVREVPRTTPTVMLQRSGEARGDEEIE